MRLREFAPDGFEQYRLYQSDGVVRHFYDKFSSVEDAVDEVEFLWNTDLRTRLVNWLVVDARDIVVWYYDPQEMADQPQWYLRKPDDANEDYDPNGPPPGPESRPRMPAGTVRVDVSDVYDWYKLGQHISNLKGLGRHDFGQGPPSAIFSFGDEDTEHKYIDALKKTGLSTTDVDPPGGPRIKGQKKDPTYDVDENFADGKVKGKSRPGRVKRAGASCSGSVSDLRARAKKSGGEKGKMYHWCANMKSGRRK